MPDPDLPGYRHRKGHIFSKIRSLLILLTNKPSRYDEVASKIEYWIEYVICESLVTVDELVEGVSEVAWDKGGSFASVARFFKEFHDAPHRSGQARSFVAQLYTYILQWFAIASVDDLSSWSRVYFSISPGGGSGFVRAASFVGHIIESGLLAHDLVRRHLIKSLTNHDYHHLGDKNSPGTIRANAIYQLFAAAGNTLLRGLLEPGDAQVCFGILDTRREWIEGFEPAKLQEFREIHAAWMQRKDEEQQRDVGKTEEHPSETGHLVAAEASAGVETLVAFAPQNLPTTAIEIETPPSISQKIESSAVFNGLDALPEPFISVTTGAASPTLSISTISDLTPTEFGEDIEHASEQMATRHDTFYFEDGNVEITCGDTIFRVHSTTISFSSPKLRDILSQPALLGAPTPGGCPRVTVSDSAEDFAILLKLIYTPGFPPRHKTPEFVVFASLLRMTTKYGFSSVRDQLVEDLRGAYPTKWEDFQGAKVLGEDIFGSPKPHPNAVLNLFEAENVRFAIPFAAYRASIGGVSALMSDKPGTSLPPRTLAATVHGMHEIRPSASDAARVAVYREYPRVCPDKACALNVEIRLAKERMMAMEKVYSTVIGQREGGLLSSPALGHIFCAKCAKPVEVAYATWGSAAWKQLPPAFGVSRGWDDL